MRLVLLFNAGHGPRFHNGDSIKRELAATRKAYCCSIREKESRIRRTLGRRVEVTLWI
jgi:hypothetical protein